MVTERITFRRSVVPAFIEDTYVNRIFIILRCGGAGGGGGGGVTGGVKEKRAPVKARWSLEACARRGLISV
jgi:hypothetical protein